MRDIFVFGSNLAGRHGRGAALHAAKVFGAVRGVGEGLTGNAYAIPTKGFDMEVLPLDDIGDSISRFSEFAIKNNGMRFILTPIGTGLAGYTKREIWALLMRAGLPGNVLLTAHWVNESAGPYNA